MMAETAMLMARFVSRFNDREWEYPVTALLVVFQASNLMAIAMIIAAKGFVRLDEGYLNLAVVVLGPLLWIADRGVVRRVGERRSALESPPLWKGVFYVVGSLGFFVLASVLLWLSKA